MKTERKEKRLHVRTVSLGNRKSCPTCKAKLNGESIWSSGEYVFGKWRNVKYFCKSCFHTELKTVVDMFEARNKDRVVVIENKSYGPLPEWMKL